MELRQLMIQLQDRPEEDRMIEMILRAILDLPLEGEVRAYDVLKQLIKIYKMN